MATGYDLQCPAKSEWRLRANISCYSENKYVCLFNLLENKYEENCLGSDLSSIGKNADDFNIKCIVLVNFCNDVIL